MIRSGKGDAFREVPLNALLRQVLDEWLEERRQLAGEDEHAGAGDPDDYGACLLWPDAQPLGS